MPRLTLTISRTVLRTAAIALLCTTLFVFPACKHQQQTESSSKAALSSELGSEFAVESLQANTPAPSFSASDLEGQIVSLEQYRGKLVLLNFWATWCVPCIAEMPALERLQKLYKDRGLEIIAISADPHESVPVVEKFVRENGLSFKILLDPKLEISEKYGVSGFPETLFVDSQGKLMSVLDPESKKHEVRVISDRPWDSDSYRSIVEQLLKMSEKSEKGSNDSNPS